MFSADRSTLATTASNHGVILLWDMSPYIAAPTIPTSVTMPAVPFTSGLDRNHPNPFNSTTLIPYRLATHGSVRLEIYNVLGQPVRTLVDEVKNAGSYQVHWDARDQGGFSTAAGVYLAHLLYPGGVQTRRLLVLR